MDPVYSAIGGDVSASLLCDAFAQWAEGVGMRRGAGDVGDLHVEMSVDDGEGDAWLVFAEPRGTFGNVILQGIGRALARELGKALRLASVGNLAGLAYRHYRIDPSGRFDALAAAGADAFLLDNEHPDDGDVYWEYYEELLCLVVGREVHPGGGERWSRKLPTGNARLDDIVLRSWGSRCEIIAEGARMRVAMRGVEGSRAVWFLDAAEWTRIEPVLRR